MIHVNENTDEVVEMRRISQFKGGKEISFATFQAEIPEFVKHFEERERQTK